MNKEEEIDALKGRLAEYMEKKLTPSPKAGKGKYVCPFCGSGTGKSKTGDLGMIKGKDAWACHCGAGGDIFNLIGRLEGITDFPAQVEFAKEFFSISGTDAGNPSREYQNRPKTERTPDFSEYLEKCHKRVGLVHYFQNRGLSDATINHFRLGFDPDYGKNGIKYGAIIPSGKSYCVRNISQDGQRYAYPYGVPVELFNQEALEQSEKPVWIVEGAFDAMSIYEAGGEAVGLNSTSGANKLIAYLEAKPERPKVPLILALDPDEAGGKAKDKLKAALKRLKLPFLALEDAFEGKDPNDALKANRGAFLAQIEAFTLERVEQIQNEEKNKEQNEYLKSSTKGQLASFIHAIDESHSAPFMPTGFPSLDKVLDGGLYPGLYIMGAISSLGKTTFCLQVADQVAQAGHDVLIFSLEMSRFELMAKSISRHTYINAGRGLAKTTRGIMTGRKYKAYSDLEKDVIKAAIRDYGSYPGAVHIIEGMGELGVNQVKDAVGKHIKMTGNKPLVLIDYLQILAPHNERATDKQNTDKAVLELKRLSRDLELPVLAISSFNRDNYSAPVNLSSFKESGAVEYGSDVLLALQYEGMDYQEGEADKAREKRIRELRKRNEADSREGNPVSIQLKILKNRNGAKADMLLDAISMFNYYLEQKEAGLTRERI